MRSLYGVLSNNSGIVDVLRWVQDVVRERANDVSDYETQQATKPTIYPVPSSGTDFIGTEKAGDIAADEHHLYVVVDIAGVLTWRRTSLTNFP